MSQKEQCKDMTVTDSVGQTRYDNKKIRHISIFFIKEEMKSKLPELLEILKTCTENVMWQKLHDRYRLYAKTGRRYRAFRNSVIWCR